MTDREKLIELIKEGKYCPDDHDPFGTCEDCRYYGVQDCHAERIADYLIANGVTVQNRVGCAFCVGAKSISGTFTASGSIDKDHLFNVNMDGDANFCPMCGRKLQEPPKEGE